MSDSKTSSPSSLLPEVSSKTKKSMAKAGMAVSLGTLVATGLMETSKTPTLKRVHLWSGFALVGFSYWHYSLYKKS
ncbi:hypothetical protein SAMN02745704_00124 [Paucidesulfovibrio gracilis DSM 16080]|uniref:Uncharacterized protein n=1 Tax=Paucidesulfovibrio gracilis DSM 16080 TaxID=1121449 RepID=A0A1T4W3P6_9BACT|nr:hypothetical protein [Paucidesulfovibrio gracilis]SKA71351.1 hypothetical protein SAMN02745704_00124 [Paucidesulfovibrio gracilis DSM 16080]